MINHMKEYLNNFLNNQILENIEMLKNFEEEDFYIFNAREIEEKIKNSTRFLMQAQDILLKTGD